MLIRRGRTRLQTKYEDEKSMLKGLPQLEIRTNTICAGMSVRENAAVDIQRIKIKNIEPLEFIHSDVFGYVK